MLVCVYLISDSFSFVDHFIDLQFFCIKSDIYSLRNVRHVVLDEADCLLDDSFSESLIPFLNKMNVR